MKVRIMEKINARVFKQRRRKNGRIVESEFYYLEWSVNGSGHGVFSLKVRERQVADKLRIEFIREKERELSGLTAPRLERDAARKLLTDISAEFLAHLKGLNRSASHVRHVNSRLRKLIEECEWRHVADITRKSFDEWRQKKASVLSVKTRNEYRAVICSLLSWMEESDQLAANPLKGLKKTDGRGLEKIKRRAATPGEMERLLSIAGDYRLGYQAAVTTGLRRGELEKIEWGDLHLEEAQPCVLIRAATTKNRKAAKAFLCPQLAAELARATALAGVSVERSGVRRADCADEKDARTFGGGGNSVCG